MTFAHLHLEQRDAERLERLLEARAGAAQRRAAEAGADDLRLRQPGVRHRFVPFAAAIVTGFDLSIPFGAPVQVVVEPRDALRHHVREVRARERRGRVTELADVEVLRPAIRL